MDGEPTLQRTMTLPTLVLYGMGGMVGAGIYGTIGVAAGAMGNAVWISFVISMVAALLTGFSYASLGSRYPKAGGVAFVTQRAYHRAGLAYVVGLSVAASGLTSMATGANVFAHTLAGLLPDIPWQVALVVFLLLLLAINLIGIRESMWMNVLCTLIEVGGLFFIIAIGAKYWGSVDYLAPADGKSLSASVLFSGAVLTFYAFIGFEDILNVSEEVKNPERTVPRGIVLALLATTVLYILISITAVSVVDSAELGNTKLGAPLSQITAKAAPWVPGWVYGVITLFAVGNTALLNYIMGSRMLYGMSRQGLLPKVFGRVHPVRRTPTTAIMFLAVLVLGIAFLGNIPQLASATSLLLLGCFCVVNVALVVLKRRRSEPRGQFEVPVLVPIGGAIVCVGLIIARLTQANANWRAPVIALALVAGISLLYFFVGRKAPGSSPPAV